MNFRRLHIVQTAPGVRLTSFAMDTGGLFPRRKRQRGHEPDHSPQLTDEADKRGRVLSTSFVVLCLTKLSTGALFNLLFYYTTLLQVENNSYFDYGT
jgi:hypothetical protein